MKTKDEYMKNTNGDCFKNALLNAGIYIPENVNIPEWIDGELVEPVCNQLGLTLYSNGNIQMGVEPCIVVFEIDSDLKIGHAEFTNDIGNYLDKKIVGIIRWQNENIRTNSNC